VIAGGRVVADSRPHDLLTRSRHHGAIAVRLRADQAPDLEASLTNAPRIAVTEAVADQPGKIEMTCYPANGLDILRDVQQAIERADVEVLEIRVERGRLDDVFRDLTQAA
jgi:ABC-2 type transport system ATP-binding protein